MITHKVERVDDRKQYDLVILRYTFVEAESPLRDEVIDTCLGFNMFEAQGEEKVVFGKSGMFHVYTSFFYMKDDRIQHVMNSIRDRVWEAAHGPEHEA